MSVNQKVVVCNKCGLGYLTNCRLPIPNFFLSVRLSTEQAEKKYVFSLPRAGVLAWQIKTKTWYCRLGVPIMLVERKVVSFGLMIDKTEQKVARLVSNAAHTT